MFDTKLSSAVTEIIERVRVEGEKALKEFSRRFDGYDGPIKVQEEELENSSVVSDEDREIIERIIERVKDYHVRQLPRDELYVKNGSVYGLVYRPLRRIGIYVPGGKPLPSSLIMTAIPARIAGVEEIVVVSPPRDGKLNPHLLYVARRLGISEIYKIGGAHAVAAMAFGVGMKPVEKIFGPGNKYVNEAKRQVFGVVGIDSLAGPSEVCVVADDSADERYVIADLLSQKEHDVDAKAWLLTTSVHLAERCKVPGISVKLMKTLEECIDEVNSIAPEHLEIITKDPLSLLERVRNAGAVYIGPYTPVAAADYFLGVNHVLPTGGAAVYSSVLTVFDFMKRMTVASVSREEFMGNRYLGVRMAQIEGMEAHRRSLEVRE
ncbi:MAG: histidinol dehydrogenase [Thermotogota bacterium]|nr:histidinol dehydrogenase [Thermotogota bacterium]MDK2864321.1 histidinol dehydrogenase [Thermotogota bacterium]HCZ06345.1 histidinol dehydrogenase [Thermotogota bacterium]